jgi:heme exporter protein C
MQSTMLAAMLIMMFAFWAYCIAVVLHRLRSIMLERERRSEWVKQAVSQGQ